MLSPQRNYWGDMPPVPPGFGAFLTKMEVGICENGSAGKWKFLWMD